MKTLAYALLSSGRWIFGAFEMAELEDDPEVRRAWLAFADRRRWPDRRGDRRSDRGAVKAST